MHPPDADEQYRMIFDASVEAQLIIDEGGRIEVLNAAAERLLGYDAAELVGRNVSILMPEPHASGHDAHLSRYLGGGEPRVIGVGRDVEARRRDGSRVAVTVSVSEIVIGGRRRFVGSMRDLTALHAAEEAVRRERDRYAAIIGALHDGLIFLSDEGVVREVNDRLLEMVGLEREAVLGLKGPPLPFHADPDEARAEFERIHRAGSDGETELAFRRPDGTTFPVRVSVAPVHDRDGAVVGRVATCRDLGPYRAAMEEARRREIAQRRSEALLIAERDERRLKDEFIAMVSHELRTPLSAVLGYLELAIADERDPDVAELLEVAQRNGVRLNELVQDVLTLSRASAGRLDLDRRPVELGHLVREAVVDARPAAISAGVELTEEITDGPVASVEPARIRQVIDNLISNAIKFSAPGDAVTVGLDVGEEGARITVSDRGPGIPPRLRRRIFDAFYRAPQGEGRTAVPGSGLGLAVARAIVLEHDGSIGVSGRRGGGSAFRLSLPRMEGA